MSEKISLDSSDICRFQRSSKKESGIAKRQVKSIQVPKKAPRRFHDSYKIPMANIFSYPMIKFDMSLKQFQKPIS